MNLDTASIALLGTTLTIASFFGLFKLAGTLVGRRAAKKYKATKAHLEATVKDPVKLQAIVDAMNKANVMFTGEQGQNKMNWVINVALPHLAKFIPGEADDLAIKDFFQGIYDGYKNELIS